MACVIVSFVVILPEWITSYLTMTFSGMRFYSYIHVLVIVRKVLKLLGISGRHCQFERIVILSYFRSLFTGFVVRGESPDCRLIRNSLYVGVVEKPPPPSLTHRGALPNDGAEIP